MRYWSAIGLALLTIWFVAFYWPRIGGSDEGAASSPSASPEKNTVSSFVSSDMSSRLCGGYLPLLEGREEKERSVSVEAQNVLKYLTSSKVPTREDATAIAIRDKLKRGGILAEERVHVVSLVKSAVDSAGFLSQGDLVWIVHITRLSGTLPGGISQEAWIDARTGDVRWMLPMGKGEKVEEKR